MAAEHDDWDAHWDAYAAAASLNPAQQMRHALVVRWLRKRAGVASSMRVFDIGSGQGDLLVRLRTAFPQAELLGAELSRSGVELSRRKVPDATVVEANLFNAPPALAAFAGWATHGVCSEVLEHVDEPGRLLEAAGMFMAPGSHLVVTVPGGPMSAFDRHIGHRRHFTRASIAAVLEQGGFEVETVNLAGFPFFNLYRLLVIARGERLAADVEDGGGRGPGWAASLAMAVFRLLFRANLPRSPWGWQVVAVGRKR